MNANNAPTDQRAGPTDIEFVLVELERYLFETIRPEYRRGEQGMMRHHLLILTKHKLVVPYYVQQAELAPQMINCVMQEL